MAEAILKNSNKTKLRIGHGYDVHRLVTEHLS